MIHAKDLALAISDRLQEVAEIFIRQIDVQIFKRLEQRAILRPLKDHFGPRDHQFIAFAAHLLHQDCDLHFAARVDLECACSFGIVDLKRNVAARFTNQAFFNMPRSHKFSVATCKRRIVDENAHPNGWWIDIDELKWRAFLEISERFTYVNILEAG